jgi:Glutathione S-transferase, N-terminal domain
MKLYICWGTFKAPRPGGHPCANAYEALKEAGHDPELVRTYGWAPLGPLNVTRRKVKELTDERWVPVLELDDGTIVKDSKEIVAWARANPATAQEAPAGG